MNLVPQHPDSATEIPPSLSSAAARTISPSRRHHPRDQHALFTDIYNYPWAQDSEFQSGLFSILGRDDQGSASSATDHHHDQGLDPDLLLQAQCFYFSQYSLPHLLPSPHSTECAPSETMGQTRQSRAKDISINKHPHTGNTACQPQSPP
jgi:hypothetical protein